MEDIKQEQTNKNTEPSAVDKDKATNNVATDSKEKTFTQEDVEKIITKRLEREKKKMKDEKDEAERLAKMSEADRLQEVFRKEKESFEQEKLKYQKEQLKFETVKQLNAKELPIEFVDFIVTNNAEDTLNNLKTFEAKWQKAIEKAVNEKLKGSTPKAGDTKENSVTNSTSSFISAIKEMQVKR
ncbi:DUF4355 domain-containing protein [Clostridium botulinum]|uniref:DUF4355 domain-containing protein n=1 Tax=Clostridium botulinum TaxID=1491 RepID=UPI001E4D0F17|nr:DUF4355 domain-containing protein [Clostridium botulinum]MCD3254379.1 DUF4355 domain-containing protein [Clostridium botulinum C/D]MCD3279879.1 DUF4355 domain-containing protein [Clostridium botulinum C/D]MCD3339610.1 DUF4355 domain-containing protein [Clostridium botulinum C/D]MCD3357518.1 DUF4355 domain-containing protein [Clostridium botulinum C/D]